MQLEGCQGAKPSRKGWEKEQQLKKQMGWRYIGNTSQAEPPFTVSTVELSKKKWLPSIRGEPENTPSSLLLSFELTPAPSPSLPHFRR
jgi:hypothetical protein